MNIYSEKDLTIIDSGVDYVKKHPNRFLRSNNLGLELSTNIAGDALLLTNEPVTNVKAGDWWVISSNGDWLTGKLDYTVEEIFSRILPFPEAGQNSMRNEILLSAFAKDVVTILDEEITVIKGDLTDQDKQFFDSRQINSKKRTVAFRL